jgi:aspartate 1-decarboxylase
MYWNCPKGITHLTFATMLIEVLKSKIHRITVTEANLNYIGSITLDPLLMEAANMIEGEKVQVLNCMNGERLETYIITGERNSGVVCLNGPAARKVEPGDVVIVVTYAHMSVEEAKNFKPAIVFPDTTTNKIQ